MAVHVERRGRGRHVSSSVRRARSSRGAFARRGTWTAAARRRRVVLRGGFPGARRRAAVRPACLRGALARFGGSARFVRPAFRRRWAFRRTSGCGRFPCWMSPSWRRVGPCAWPWLVSFRNLDSLAISVVLSVAYRNSARPGSCWPCSAGPTDRPLTDRAGAPVPLSPPAIDRHEEDAQGMANVEDENTPGRGSGGGVATTERAGTRRAHGSRRHAESPAARRRRPDRSRPNTPGCWTSTITASGTSRKARSSRAPFSK